ncbi:neuralized-like protein 4 isoform X2 [Pomacea canaliculata]|uniref:neuralized-like protein 4 isoform X2 n=1 Tax=Pomacea canaliculata TaxID=400727 RepID=UPI000D737496|nr:neuralized-like protein 4 isoform X2 [Pomacea canaliculata]
MAAQQPQFHSRTGSLIILSNNNRTAQRNHPAQEFNNGVVLSAEPLRDNVIFEVCIVKKVNSWSGSIEIGVTTCNPDTLTLPFSATGLREGTWIMSGTSLLRDGQTTSEQYGVDLDQLGEGDRVGVMRTLQGELHFFVNGEDQGSVPYSRIPTPIWAVVDLYGKCVQVTITDTTTYQSNRQNALVSCQIANDLANEFLTELSNHIANNLASACEMSDVCEAVAAAAAVATAVSASSTVSESSIAIAGANKDSFQPSNERLVFSERNSPPSADRSSNEHLAYNERLNLLSSLTNDRLTFHERCGSLIKLSNGRRTAERRRPMEEFNNGVVMTNRPLRDDELFEIRLDRLVDKWSGSIEVGITTHNPNTLDFPATMTNMRSRNSNRTIMMSGCGILTNGKGTRREYGQFNLDELTEGDRIGLIRKNTGCLHYYINGMDQGLAAANCPSPVWGVVDLYGMAVKVTILDFHDPSYPNNPPAPERRANSLFRHYPDLYDEEALEEEEEVEKLTFHPRCGGHAAVINAQRTAHRPNALDDFNNGVVLTSRPLRPGEMFEVRLEKMVDKWAGSIEIGVTLHQPQDLDFPSTMTNIRSGTWMMTGNGVMHNGTTVIDEYGQNLDRLKVGDRVGVLRKPNGTLHFFVNGVDQGVAASNVPDNVYGVIDLYGQAAQATIVDQADVLSSPDLDSSVFLDSDELRFHTLHGRNAAVINNGRTAVRTNDTGEFNDAIVMSSRPLRDNELFEVVIEKLVERWSGSLEAGVTMVKPEDIDFPSTMTDIQYDTWMLSGAAIMQDGAIVRNGYPLDLDSISVGTRIGMMRCFDGTLHYFRDGVDMGIACSDIPPGVYAVVDLYGLCAQVSITGGSVIRPADTQVVVTTAVDTTEQSSSPSVLKSGTSHRFSNCCGKNITIKNNGRAACRTRGFSHGVVFSSDPLKYDEVFEVRIDQMAASWSGSLRIGLTTMAISDTTSPAQVPSSADQITSKITWIVSGTTVQKCGALIKDNYAPALERLQIGTRIGVRHCSDGTMHMCLNGEDLGVAASNIPKNVFAVVDLYGAVESVTITSSALAESFTSLLSLADDLVTDRNVQDQDQDEDTSVQSSLCFHSNHGKNIMLSDGQHTARRLASYNQGIVVSAVPLPRNQLLQVRIEMLDPQWSGSLQVGVIGFPPDRLSFPGTATAIKKSAIVLQGHAVFACGIKSKEHYGCDLTTIGLGHTIGILVDSHACLHVYVDGQDQGVAYKDVPQPCYGLFDLYGQCTKVTISKGEDVCTPSVAVEEREKADLEDVVKEKVLVRHPSISLTLSRICEYFNICTRLKASLGLPDGYFDSQQMTCFCEACHKLRGDDLYHKRGDPPRDYALPYGWCRFALRPQCKAHSLNVAEKWHTAYHGTRLDLVRRILDHGDLLSPGDTGSVGSILLPQPQVYTEKSRPENLGSQPIFFSPTLRYAGSADFCPKHKFHDPRNRKIYQARVAFQIWVKPGSYKVGGQAQGSGEDIAQQVDPHFRNSELAWSTKEKGSLMLHALLLKVE